MIQTQHTRVVTFDPALIMRRNHNGDPDLIKGGKNLKNISLPNQYPDCPSVRQPTKQSAD